MMSIANLCQEGGGGVLLGHMRWSKSGKSGKGAEAKW